MKRFNANGPLNASRAAKALRVTIKTLRVYEKAGLLTPARSQAGYREYHHEHLHRACVVIELRRMGFKLAQIARLAPWSEGGMPMSDAMAAHEAILTGEMGKLARQLDRNRFFQLLCTDCGNDAERDGLPAHASDARSVSFRLPSPWNGGVFVIPDIRRLNYIVGPPGSGKTQLALKLSWVLGNTAFIGLDRLRDGGLSDTGLLNLSKTDRPLAARIGRALSDLVDDGATPSGALRALVYSMEVACSDEAADFLIVEAVEEGLDRRTQEAVGAYLRRRAAAAGGERIFAVTRSAAIVDLATAGDEQSAILCPPNHSPPIIVPLRAGAYGYETLCMCLVSGGG